MFAYLPRKYLVIGIKLEILLEYRCNTKTGITNKGWNCTPNDDDNAEICALRHIIVECVRNRGERRIVLGFALYSWILVIFICQINEFRFSLLLWWRCERGGMNITWRGRAISVRECVFVQVQDINRNVPNHWNWEAPVVVEGRNWLFSLCYFSQRVVHTHCVFLCDGYIFSRNHMTHVLPFAS